MEHVKAATKCYSKKSKKSQKNFNAEETTKPNGHLTYFNNFLIVRFLFVLFSAALKSASGEELPIRKKNS